MKEELENKALANETAEEEQEGHWEEVEMPQAELSDGCLGLIIIVLSTAALVALALSR